MSAYALLHRIPPRLRLLLLPALLLTLMMSLLRIGFWLYFDPSIDPLPLADLPWALYLGMKFDLRVALLLLLPLALLGWIAPLSPLTRFGRHLWSGYLALAVGALLLFYMVDFGHYSYLNKRIDHTILHFFADQQISLEMVWQSYPVVPLTLLLLLALIASAIGMNRHLRHYAEIPYSPLPLKGRTLLITAAVLLYFFAIFAKISWYPLRWSDAFFSPHPFTSAVASNPAVFFVYTVMSGGTPVDENATRAAYPLMADYLQLEQPDPHANPLRYDRSVAATPLFTTPPNVVVVVIESFAAFKSGISGNPLNPTPHFDAIARNGIWFRNYFTPHTGTARSIFTLMTGIPDVQPNETASRNPTIAQQQTVANAFSGYEKFYLLGGSASWGNIRALFSNNIPNIQIYEEGSYSAPAVDVWGISDLDLFREAHQIFKQQSRPFFAVIQTSGTHRPYTIPEDNAGFRRDPPSLTVTEYGFTSLEEYHAYRFLDHALGEWMRLAQQERYFENTLFIFTGDHGLTQEAGRHALKQESQLGLGSYRVPLVFYAPRHLTPAVRTTVASEVDLLTTAAAISGHSHRNTTFGRNLFDPRYDSQRYAFTIDHGNPLRIGLIGDHHYYQIHTDGSHGQLHPLGDDQPRRDLSAEDPERAATMRALALGYYETARYQLNHNRRLDRPERR